MENLITLEASTRGETGKRKNKVMRRQGKVPAIIYGLKADSLPVSVEVNDIKRIIKSEGGENSILRIVHDGKSNLDAMIKEIQYDYLSKNIIHVDFIRIDLKKPVEVNVPIVLEGEPVGIKTEDGLLDFVNREVTVRCLPTNIPRMIKIDISELHVGHSLKVEDLPRSEDVLFVSHPLTVVCAVVSRTKEEVKEVVPEAVEGEVPTEEGKPAAEKTTEPAPAPAAAKKEG